MDHATERHTFKNVYVSYEGEPIARDAGKTDFASIFQEAGFEGEWLVATSPEATFMFTGYPSNTYKCRASRIGYIKFQTATSETTNVWGNSSKRRIEVETGINSGRLTTAQWLYPDHDGWEPLEEWKRFGPNGKQVVWLIDWIRREIRNDAGFKRYQAVLDGSQSRAKAIWPQAPFDGYTRNIWPPDITRTWKFWKRGSALARSWHNAVVAAVPSSIWWSCKYVSPGGPWLVAITLRHLLSPEDFQELYAEFEQFYPLDSLDRDEPPGEYTIGKLKPPLTAKSNTRSVLISGALCLGLGLFLGSLWHAHQAEVSRTTVPAYYEQMGSAVEAKANAILAASTDAQAFMAQHPGGKFFAVSDATANWAEQDTYCPDDALVLYDDGKKDFFEARLNARTKQLTQFQSMDASNKDIIAKINASGDQDEKVDTCVDGSMPSVYERARGESDSDSGY